MRVGLCVPEVHPLVTLPLASPDTITTLRVKSAAFAHQRPDKCWVFTIKCSVDAHEALNSEQKALQIFVLFVCLFFSQSNYGCGRNMRNSKLINSDRVSSAPTSAQL